MLSPRFEGTGLGWKSDRLSLSHLLVGDLQIFQQDAPGDSIDCEMMNNDQQEMIFPSSPLEEDNAQERPLSEIEAGLRLGGELGDRPILRLFVKRVQVNECKGNDMG